MLIATPAIIGNILPESIAGLIVVGIIIGLSTPSAIKIWLSLKTLARLATRDPHAPDDRHSNDPVWRSLRAMVQNGLATVLLALLLILSLPLIVQLWLLGNLSASLSLLLLLGPAVAMGMISFRVHRVLESAFSDTFTDDSVSPEPHPADGLEHTGFNLFI